jgi:hypothetical protein
MAEVGEMKLCIKLKPLRILVFLDIYKITGNIVFTRSHFTHSLFK